MRTVKVKGEFPFYVSSDGNCGPIYSSLAVFDMDSIPSQYDDEFTALLENEDYDGILNFLKNHKIKAIIIDGK